MSHVVRLNGVIVKFRCSARYAPYAITLSVAALVVLAPLAAPATALASSASRVAVGSPGAHPAAASAIAGCVFSDNNNSSFDAYNSVEGNGGVAVGHDATGQYQVTFFGMGSIASKAVAQVSSAEQANTCAIGSWIAVGKDLQVIVDCFESVGGSGPAD